MNEWLKWSGRKRNWWFTAGFALFVAVILFFQAAPGSTDQPGQWEVMVSIAGMMQLVILFAVIFAAESVSSEWKWGTAPLLFVRPVKRYKVFTAKFFSVCSITFFWTVLLLVVSYTGSGVIYGFESPFSGAVQAGKLALTMQIYAAYLVQAVLAVSLGLLISVIFRNPLIAAAVAAGCVLIAPMLNVFLNRRSWWHYSLFYNWDLRLYWNPSPMTPAGFTTITGVVILLCYFLILQGLALFLLSRREI